MASYPPSIEDMETWFASHEKEWLTGTAYRFAVELGGSMIGLVDIDEIAKGSGELGYWFDRANWGNGFAYEAAEAGVSFATSVIGLRTLSSSHAVDNPKSGAILTKLGFKTTTLSMKNSKPRGVDVLHQNYQLRAR